MKIDDNEINSYKKMLKKAANKINELNYKLEEATNKKEIAVIGYDCMFPGGANNCEEFWRLLSKGFDAVTEIDNSRFNVNQYFSNEKSCPGKMYTKYASFLNTDIKEFDNTHFEISAKEAQSIDPQHKLLLEVSWGAMENAGIDINKLKGSKTGVFIGQESFEYVSSELFSDNKEDITPYTLFGVMPTSAAGRISYFYDLKGPAITCDTACSSSLTALSMAVDSLRNGQCDMAIVGGVNLILGPEAFVGLSQINSLSPDGRCKTFTDAADGFGRGEGCGIVILKRANDAIRDKNKIEALIKSVSIGQDGKSNGFFAPNGISEKNVIKNAIYSAGISDDDVDYVEAHGTGTALGDCIEAQAISEAYKNKKDAMLIGSVKSNIGHLEAAAGIASLIKVLLSIKYKQIPPSIHFDKPNKNINWDKLKVVKELTPWIKTSGKRRAGINSFGISGTLAHVIVEEAETEEIENRLNLIPCNILTLSTKSEASLKNDMESIKNYLMRKDTVLNDVAYSSNIARSHLNYRFALVGNKKEKVIEAIEEALKDDKIYNYNSNKVKPKKKKIAFLFTGQGSVYVNIARQLYENSSEFKENFDICDKAFENILGISIKSAIFNENGEKLNKPIYSQAVTFTVEYALTKVWNTTDINPDVVIGHSIGEYSAACYAGLITLDEAVKMIAVRGKLMESVDVEGKMVGVLTDVETIQEAIDASGCKNVSIAAINTPKNVTISGLKDEVDKTIDILQQRTRVFVNELKIFHPYHSVIMKKYEKLYSDDLKDTIFSKLKIKMISSVTGKVEKEDVLGTKKYWSEHLSKTVNYKAAIEEAKKMGINVFIEIGGNATLSGLAEQCMDKEEAIFVPSLRNGIEDYKQLLTALKILYLNGIEINWNSFHKSYEKQKIFLPNYPFNRKKFWKENTKQNINIEKGREDNIGGIKEMADTNVNESMYTRVLSELVELVHMITGMERGEIDPDKELFAFGFDSLLLASLGKQLKIKYDIDISIGKLFTSVNNLGKLAQFILENGHLEVEEDDKKIEVSENADNMVASSVTEEYNNIGLKVKPKEVINVQDADIYDIGENTNVDCSVEMKLANKLFEKQFELMQNQNDIFKNIVGIGTRSHEKTIINKNMNQHKKEVETVKNNNLKYKEQAKTTKNNNTDKIKVDYYVPYKKMSFKKNSTLERLKLQYVKNIEKKYTKLTKKSKEDTQKYRNVYASNRNSAGFRFIFKEMLYQLIAEKGKGSKLIDIDGNELMDITMGFGVSLFGHCPEFVENALKKEIENGMPLGPMGRLSGEVARQISELTGVERVFFCNSGTEADMFAVRLARAVNKKNKIVCFKGSFHGTYDGLLGVPTYSKDPDNSTLPMAPGITENSVKDLILLDYNDDESLKYIEEHSDIIAGVLTETVQSRRPDVQPKEFLHKLRKITEENNIALIFDEIITGFRISSGGAQEFFGVQADIVTYGKVIGGGMPIGVVSGKAKYLDSIDGGMWYFGDNSVPPCEDTRTFVAGTFCHHPLAMASANAVLKHIKENKDTIYSELNDKTSRFVNKMNEFFHEENVPLHINHFGSLFRFNVTLDREIFYYGLLEKGIYVWEGRNCFFSTEHTEEDIEKVINAVKTTVGEMKAAGYFGDFTDPTDPDSGSRLKKQNIEDGSYSENSFEKNSESHKMPMSIIQQRLYSNILMNKEDPYDIISAYIVKEKLNVRKIEASVNEIIRRHEILRTAMYVEDGEYVQEVFNNWEFKVKQIIQSEYLEINDCISQAISKFDLAKPPLLEVLLITTATNKQIIVFHFHHTVADGMSMDLFVDEFSKCYRNLELPQLKKQYKDYVAWEQEYLNSSKLKEDEGYWINTLDHVPKVTAIPYDYEEVKNNTYTGNTIIGKIDAEMLLRLKNIAKINSTSLFMVLLSVINVLVHKTSRENEIAISTPVTDRFDGEFEDCIGMFTNTIILKNEVLSNETFEGLLKNVKKNFIESYEHINYPYNKLIQKLKLTGQNVFNTEFVYENVGGRSIKKTSLKLEDIQYIPELQEANITFELLECNGIVDIFLRYRTDLFKEESINILLKRFLLVLEQVVKKPNINISDIEIITDIERNKILNEFNNVKIQYPKEKTIVDLFEEQVSKTPNKVALVFEEKSLTYKELNEGANILAHNLREIGIKPNDFVAIMAERSIEVIIGVFAILKSGGAYVPIDPKFPKERIQYMIEDCEPKAILVAKEQLSINTQIPLINLYDEKFYSGKIENPKKVNKSNDLAYVIYTSGTTGRPKGVMIEHECVHNLLVAYTENYGLTNKDVVLQAANMIFDQSVWDIFNILVIGGTLCLISYDKIRNSQEIEKYCNEKKVTVVSFTPMLLNELNPNKFPYLRVLESGGEAANVTTLSKWIGKCEVVNTYGPTETTVNASSYKFTGKECKTVPIGKPIANIQIYILDGINLCGIGVPGELCIAGAGVGRGYLKREQLTEEKFVKNPFGVGRMYRSGDLARWLPDGNIEYLGRIDEQIKIRGFRIELGEIESVIRNIAYIQDTALIVRKDKSGDTAIYAYVVSKEKVNFNELRNEMGKSLPYYMIPSYIMQLDKIPLTHSGKLNRRMLPEIEAKVENEYIEPRDEMEKLLCNIFSEILTVKKVGIRDSFFELGGHSLRATKLVNEIEAKTGCKVEIKDVFRNPTVEKLMTFINKKEVKKAVTIPKAEQKEYYQMSSAQKRIYLICKIKDNSTIYNMPGSLKLKGEVYPSRMEAAIQKMIDRHEILRTEFLILNGEPVQKILDNVKADYEYLIDEETSESELMDSFVRPFDLSKAPLVRIKLVKRKNYYLLMIDTHHIISDGMSLETFTREITALYNGEELEELTHQYKDYSEWMRKRDMSSQKKYWIKQFSDEIPVLDIPIDYTRPKEQSYKGAEIEATISKELVSRIKNFARKTNTTEYIILLSAAMVFLSKYSRQEDIIIGSPISGRTHKATENMLGVFVNTLAMRGRIESEKTYLDFLEEMKISSLEAYENQEYPFEELIEEIKIKRDVARNPLFDVMLAFQNNEKEEIKFSKVDSKYSEYKGDVVKFDLLFDITENNNNEFIVELQYCTSLFKSETAERMLSHFVLVLDQVISKPDIRLGEIEVITKEEKLQIIKQFNDTDREYPVNKTVVELFEEQVNKNPDKIAVVFEDKQLTYLELNNKANSIALRLKEIGVKPNDVVAIIAHKSLEVIVGICGIIKSGAAYVPIDESYPEDRINYILNHCKPKAIITNSLTINSNLPVIKFYDVDCLDSVSINPVMINNPHDIAIIIYTSGTTGNPKGVMIENKNVVKLVKNCDYTLLDEKTNILQTCQLTFDVTTFEVWGSLLNGAKLHLINKSILLNGELLKKYLIDNKITTMFITTALFNQMISYDSTIFDSLKYLMFGGEAASEEHIRILTDRNSNIDIRNMYGPTETTTFTTHYKIENKMLKTPIGKPISNTQIYILNQKCLCGIGVPGELCIAGDGVSRGYLNNPKLTDEKFVDNPFGEGKMYHSGDLARWLPDGNIEYLGRIDEQIKIRGFRIELEEIEDAIRSIEYVLDAAVIIREPLPGDKAISAYIVANKDIDIAEIRQKLGLLIPQYMIPAYIMQIDSMPFTPNGKIDKRALPEIKVNVNLDYIEPRSEGETTLCKAFEEVLNVEKIGVKDNFFELGGDSLKAIRVISNIRENGYIVTVQNIMQYQTVEGICPMMNLIDKKLILEENNAPVYGEVSLGAIQKLFLESNLYNPNHFNMSMMFELPERVIERNMIKAVSAVVQHHDMLRVIVKDGAPIIDKREEDKLFGFKVYDLREYSNINEIREKINDYILKSQCSINLKTGPLMSVVVFNLKNSDHIHICINHFVVDAVSMRIIAEDIFTAYYYCNNDEPIRLPQKTASFNEWVKRFKEFIDQNNFNSENEYWNNINDMVKSVELPIVRKSNESEMFNYESDVELKGLSVLANKVLNTGIDNILMAATAKAVCNKYNKEKIAINIEVHGRYDSINNVFVDRTVGWFTSMYPLIFKVGEDLNTTIDNMLKEINNIPNKGMGYLLASDKFSNNINMPQITINYVGSIAEGNGSMHDIKMSEFLCGNDMDKMNSFLSSLSINVSMEEDKLKFDFNYDSAIWCLSDIKEIFEGICEIFMSELYKNKKEIEAIINTKKNNIIEQVLEDAEHKMNAYEQDIVSNTEYKDYPLMGIQKVSYGTMARNSVIEIPLFDKIDLKKFNKALIDLHFVFDVLRSSISINDNFIRIYSLKNIKIPFIDISKYSKAQMDEIIEKLLEKIDCYEQESMYNVDKLSSKVILVKVSAVAYRFFMSSTHLIFDRFSSEVLKNKLMDIYYKRNNNLVEHPYKEYIKLLSNDYVSISEEDIIKGLNLDSFYKTFKAFYEKNKERRFRTYIYKYSNLEKWSKLSDKEMLTMSHDIFIKAMQFIFKDTDIPLFALHILRKNKYVNLFNYIGELLDVFPINIPLNGEISIEKEIEEKLLFINKNNICFSSLMSSDSNSKYIKIRNMIDDIYKMSRFILVYNNTGILKSANDLIVDSENYTSYYNVMCVEINNKGISMNVPIDNEVSNEIKEYLDSTIDTMLSKYND
ncbi:hybrid non-ribosomal peptide synthetase/type I polyketide synthase [Clostridium felsineum]|uniref:D-alanine--D-alanyl carrier protein ligase n=1 Tax=Clostridium felsineum TaxID=36839 RepID=A0A1S8MC09_9CLOT|nr:hybrid non-ribosomal peptide synthetase/type I polyketide synthase [Clostridium felsineum]URZ07873.1 D-alanine--D-alanyl carrier protein ligase [Clostridium felsineum]URZ12904.1 D-alanine--D-alanyl carrier protein ligase [Clostridium felsineum]